MTPSHKILFMLLAVLGLGACEQSPDEKMIHVDARVIEGLKREDEFQSLYKFAMVFQVDNEAEFFNGLTQEPMDVAKTVPYAVSGDSGAQLSLFFRYYQGVDKKLAAKHRVQPVTVDVCSAANWLHKAARQRHPTALLWMTYISARGDGIARDLKQSLFWYMTWLRAHKFETQNPFPLRLADFGVSEVEYQAMRDGYTQWEEKEMAAPPLELQACPGVEPRKPKKV